MTSTRKNRIRALLKGIETGDATSVDVINPVKYIQHNPQTYEGREGLAALFRRLSKTSPHVNIVRIFQDSDYIFAHAEYVFSDSNIGFEIFKFEDDMTVEHWDNIQLRQGPNGSNHSMVDGPTEANDLTKTEVNRQIVQSFVDNILINVRLSKLDTYINDEHFIQHNPYMVDGITTLSEALKNTSKKTIRLKYEISHRILAEGNFVLSVCEGYFNGVHSAIYDLFRVAGGKLVEHWDTIEAIPPPNEWKNDNGKF